jgi:hypothetical protein
MPEAFARPPAREEFIGKKRVGLEVAKYGGRQDEARGEVRRLPGR